MKTYSLITSIALSTMFGLSGNGVAFGASGAKHTAEKMQTEFYDLIDKDVAGVSFDHESWALSEAEKANIRSTYKSVLKDDSVRKIIVAAWPDSRDIVKQQKTGVNPSEHQIALAEKRAKAIHDVLVELGAKNIEVHNMAQDAGWVAKTFHTNDAKIKDAVKNGATSEKSTNEIVAQLEAKGGLSKAVVVVLRKNSESML